MPVSPRIGPDAEAMYKRVKANIISMTGQAIIKAILVGERDPSDKVGAVSL
jgi:hypothetical protein